MMRAFIEFIYEFFFKKNYFCCRCPHVLVNNIKNDEKSISYVVGTFFLLRCATNSMGISMKNQWNGKFLADLLH